MYDLFLEQLYSIVGHSINMSCFSFSESSTLKLEAARSEFPPFSNTCQ